MVGGRVEVEQLWRPGTGFRIPMSHTLTVTTCRGRECLRRLRTHEGRPYRTCELAGLHPAASGIAGVTPLTITYPSHLNTQLDLQSQTLATMLLPPRVEVPSSVLACVPRRKEINTPPSSRIGHYNTGKRGTLYVLQRRRRRRRGVLCCSLDTGYCDAGRISGLWLAFVYVLTRQES